MNLDFLNMLTLAFDGASYFIFDGIGSHHRQVAVQVKRQVNVVKGTEFTTTQRAKVYQVYFFALDTHIFD